jgi:hypothetical protein
VLHIYDERVSDTVKSSLLTLGRTDLFVLGKSGRVVSSKGTILNFNVSLFITFIIVKFLEGV